MALSTLKIIVFGEEWTGKSSVGNIILGKTTFDANTETQWNSLGTGKVHNKRVVVVDTPGWDSLCSETTPLRILADACHSLGQRGPEADPHALLLTIPVSMNLEWNRCMSRRLKRLFSPRIWRQTILLFTRPSCLNGRSIEYHLEHAGRPFRGLVERCGNRYHTLNTCPEDHEEVSSLLEKIERMVEENCGECFNTKDVVLEMREQYDIKMEQLAMSYSQPDAQFKQILEEQQELKLHWGPHIGLRVKEEYTSVEHEESEVFEEQRYQEENVTCVPESYVGDKVPQQPALSLVSTEQNGAPVTPEVHKVEGCGLGVTRPETPKDRMEILLFIKADVELQKVRISVLLVTLVTLHHGSKLHWGMILTFAWWQIVVVNRFKERSGIQRKTILPLTGGPLCDYGGDALKTEDPATSVKSWDLQPETKTGKETRKERGKERRPPTRQRSSSLHRDNNFGKDLEHGGEKWKQDGLKRSESSEKSISFGKPDHFKGPERGLKSFKSTKIKVKSPGLKVGPF